VFKRWRQRAEVPVLRFRFNRNSGTSVEPKP